MKWLVCVLLAVEALLVVWVLARGGERPLVTVAGR